MLIISKIKSETFGDIQSSSDKINPSCSWDKKRPIILKVFKMDKEWDSLTLFQTTARYVIQLVYMIHWIMSMETKNCVNSNYFKGKYLLLELQGNIGIP